MKRHLYYIIGGIALSSLSAVTLHAQVAQEKDSTLNRTVVVEQEYAPDIQDASKINVLPQVEDPTVSKKEVEYATTSFPATSIPAGVMNPYTAKEVQKNSLPGYVRAGYGNYGNLDVLANYLFRFSAQDKLNLRFQMDGMDGKLDNLPPLSAQIPTWEAYYYRTRANVDYTHQFDKFNLNFGGNFGLSNFNFLPESINRKQKFTSGDVHTSLDFLNETAPLQFNAEANLMFYDRQHNIGYATDPDSELKETLLRIKGLVTGAINDQQTINIALAMNNFWYGGATKDQETGQEFFKNYTTLLLNPYYELNSDNWKLHLGANVDLSFGFDKAFRVSPDVKAQYVFSDSYVLYAHATGGKLLNDFRRSEEVCPYALFAQPVEDAIIRPYDTYEQINGTLGFKASPTPGLWFNLYGGYQDLKNDLSYSSQRMPRATDSQYLLAFAQGHTHNVYAGAGVSYSYKDYLSLSARYTYRDWGAKDGYEYLLRIKPESELAVNIHIHLFSPLRMNIGYDYVVHKDVKVAPPQMPDISNLHLDVAYNVFKGVSIYARVNNLLNKEYQYYLTYPTEGFNFLGGLSFQF